MVIVTGTKRSGTSLWMQILIGAGLHHLGDAFPSTWGRSIRHANPQGFYESRLRNGVFFGTNPDPTSGAYLRAEDTREHVVKVFVPGVVRTERAYLHRVVATLRHWRAYARSIEALYAEEDAWLAANPPAGRTGDEAVARARARRTSLPAPVEWFLENFELVRDFAVRRYPIHFTSYERLVAEPEAVVPAVLEWVGRGEVEGAIAAIRPDLSRSGQRAPVASEDDVDPAHIELFDELYAAIHERSTVPRRLLEPLNAVWVELSERHQRADSRRATDAVVGLDDDGPVTR